MFITFYYCPHRYRILYFWTPAVLRRMHKKSNGTCAKNTSHHMDNKTASITQTTLLGVKCLLTNIRAALLKWKPFGGVGGGGDDKPQKEKSEQAPSHLTPKEITFSPPQIGLLTKHPSGKFQVGPSPNFFPITFMVTHLWWKPKENCP